RRAGPGASGHDYVPGYRDLLAWAAYAGVLTPTQERRLAAAADADPQAAAGVHRRARDLREACYAAFSALAAGRPAPPDALATIQAAYLAALRAAHLGPYGDGLDWRWPERGPLE